MQRIVKFKIVDSDYVFEESEDKRVKIGRDEIILNGTELYEMFFKEYASDDNFQLINDLSENDKKEDKLANSIFEEVQKIIASIEKDIKEKVFKPIEEVEATIKGLKDVSEIEDFK